MVPPQGLLPDPSLIGSRELYIAERSQICLLKALSADPFDPIILTNAQIAALLGTTVSTVVRTYHHAKEHGFDPKERPIHITDTILESATRSSHPRKVTDKNKKEVSKLVSLDRYAR